MIDPPVPAYPRTRASPSASFWVVLHPVPAATMPAIPTSKFDLPVYRFHARKGKCCVCYLGCLHLHKPIGPHKHKYAAPAKTRAWKWSRCDLDLECRTRTCPDCLFVLVLQTFSSQHPKEGEGSGRQTSTHSLGQSRSVILSSLCREDAKLQHCSPEVHRSHELTEKCRVVRAT